MAIVSDLEKRLQEKLRELFQFESEDLDFGIYKMMNYKRKQIEQFIEKDLIGEIQKQLNVLSKEEKERIRKELERIEQKIKEVFGENAFEDGDLKEGFRDTPLGREYYEKKKALEQINISEDLEREIYNHLINFFSRYYDNGDFISKRRYGKKEKYCIPYNGEEVYFYWVNKDQYYIKTTEYFRKYTFWDKQKRIKVNFRVVEAEEEKGNVKSQEKKFFVLSKKVFDFDKKKNELNIYFEYRAVSKEEALKNGWGDKEGKGVKQEKINASIIEILEKKIPQNSPARLIFEKDGEKTLIEKHLNRYTKRNTTDYFIHKDLKGFLERELDFYIKNEFLQLDDLDVLEKSGYFDKLRVYLIAVRVFRNVALKIIEFLAQIENFQKKLWEKKKFVIDTHYVITLDKIKEYAGEEFLESILDEILNNKEQLKEWEELFGIKVKSKKGLKKGKEWKKLPIDTRYFNEEFKWKLLVALTEKNNLDEILDGVLIKSENWQALNLLLNKYYEKVQTIYIDPPYNAKSSEILYKNTFKHSSWLSLMENRLSLGKEFLRSKDGVFIIAIDENEQERLGLLLDNIFPKYKKTMVCVVHNRRGIQGENFRYTNEFAYFIYPEGKGIIKKTKIPEEEWEFSNLRNWGGESERKFGKNSFYPIYVDAKTLEIIDVGYPEEDTFHPEKQTLVVKKDGKEIYKVYPIDKTGIERKWRFARETLMNFIKKYPNAIRVKKKGDRIEIEVAQVLERPSTCWYLKKYDASVYGTQEITNLFKKKIFDFPKSVWTVFDSIKISSNYDSLVLDFFAGSGTTAHAVMKLNSEDGGKRKFILVEMADYFDTVIIPRIKKVAYSFHWKEGKPQDTDGIGVFFKYHTLEQYEDALENVEFEQQSEKQQKLLLELPDYFVKYMLEWETKNSSTFLNVEKLKDPFNYKLRIIENYQQKTVNVDLIETFNYLLGLNVSRYKVLDENGRKYVFVFGEKEGKKIAVVWRSLENINFEEDRKIIEREMENFKPDIVYVNGDSMVKGFTAIEPVFKTLMFEKVE
ncbi:adenine-specific DNA-methyltransferase [Desulfurobacterium pacificum]|uniref:Adenine-specific DNA-methyltransferase n=1 Tax=Desulfurobacterium pacificum TaxID=240166 RepID=A0ABY1NGI6_9BACT|nr:site-specific DNA-methyltransferase [Desulfurobacterium pacificum]SMP08999.1 adenine-specific DNA-methyltransferase [Desulfurobacterium pacificum]